MTTRANPGASDAGRRGWTATSGASRARRRASAAASLATRPAARTRSRAASGVRGGERRVDVRRDPLQPGLHGVPQVGRGRQALPAHLDRGQRVPVGVQGVDEIGQPGQPEEDQALVSERDEHPDPGVQTRFVREPDPHPGRELETGQGGVRDEPDATRQQQEDQTGEQAGDAADPVGPEDDEGRVGEHRLRGEQRRRVAFPGPARATAGIPPGQHVDGHDERHVRRVGVRHGVEDLGDQRAGQHRQDEAPPAGATAWCVAWSPRTVRSVGAVRWVRWVGAVPSMLARDAWTRVVRNACPADAGRAGWEVLAGTASDPVAGATVDTSTTTHRRNHDHRNRPAHPPQLPGLTGVDLGDVDHSRRHRRLVGA